MKRSGLTAAWSWLGRTALVCVVAWGLLGGAAALGQEPGGDNGEQAAAPLADAAAQDVAEEVSSAMSEFALFVLIVGLFVVPMLLGNYFSKKLRMPDHSWKLSLAIGTLAAAAVVYHYGELKFGPDLSGGSTLIFELDKSSIDTEKMSDAEIGDLVDQTITALANRVDPSGTKEVTIRKYGLGQIEIIIPRVGDQELAYIERNIYTAGILEFRITASNLFSAHREIIDLARKLPPGKNVVQSEGKKVAQWMPYKLEEFGPVEEEGEFVKRPAGETPQILVLYNDGMDVTGDYLDSAKAQFDQTGDPSVGFTFNSRGAYLFGQLTGRHEPNASGHEYRLGIVLDNKLLSAPYISEKITGQGEITGGMGQEGVD
ncbi:MAG: hypothetical protein MI725_02910, partial [Pirellulales bacterium]|nr:hypothetical protein [Pirellulales bacterium]